MDKAFVAIIQPYEDGLETSIEHLNIRLFSSIISAQTWVDKRLADYEHDGIEVNWDIQEDGIM